MTPYQKSVAASVLLALAVGQLAAISLARGWIGSGDVALRRKATRWHHAEGYLGLAIVVIVAFYCTRLLPDSVKTTRVSVHALLGTTVVSLGFIKATVARAFPQRYAWLPYLGAALFAFVVALWISAAGWYFFWSQSAGY